MTASNATNPLPTLLAESGAQTLSVLDAEVTVMTTNALLSWIADEAADPRHRTIIGGHNINSIALLRRDEWLRSFYDLTTVNYVDGTGVVICLSAVRQRINRHDRLAVLDWIGPLCQAADRQSLRITHVGSAEPTMSAARDTLMSAHPGLQLSMISGFFDASPASSENAAVLQAIADTSPHVLLVGMGMPRQERWIVENLDALPTCVIITVGGIMGYLGGDRPTPPRWLGPLGFEWAFRLVTEPKRLWRRYLLEPLPLLMPLVRESWQLRRTRALKRQGA